MYKLMLSIGAAIVALALTGEANAHGGHSGIEVHGHQRPQAVRRAYYLDHGQRFSGGYYYRGQDHHHWAYQVWNARYHRYHYWDPNLNCYYYYDAGQACYYPVN